MSHHQDRQNLLGRFFKEIPNFREMVDSNMENPELQGLLDMVTGPHLARRDSGKAGFQGDLDHKANVAGLFKKAGGALSKLDKFSVGRGGTSFLNPAAPATPAIPAVRPAVPGAAIPATPAIPGIPVNRPAAVGGAIPPTPVRPTAPNFPSIQPQGLTGNARPNLGQSFLRRLFGQG